VWRLLLRVGERGKDQMWPMNADEQLAWTLSIGYDEGGPMW
jgi:hypothetical protein